MKKLLVLAWLFFVKPGDGIAQAVNWASFRKDQSQLVNINAGVEHGLVTGLGYGFKLRSRLPLILETDYSFPAGKDLFDDLKTRIGGQVKVYKAGNIILSASLHGIFRRYENEFARLLNFGADLSATIGYYKPRWFVATEAGFDKAISTHIKNTATYKALYPLAKDGWYEPTTGGNFFYGLQAGYSIKQFDIYIKGGRIINQDLESKPLLPFYIQLGFNARLGR